MSKESTLTRIESEIAAGDLGKARDRLHGLIATYPDDLSLRSRLAEVYSKLHYPYMAGCYWYLEENQTAETQRALVAFEKRCGGDPWMIWNWLKFRGDARSVSPFARQQLEDVISRCKKMHGSYPDLWGTRTRAIDTTKRRLSTIAIHIGCTAVLVGLGLMTLIGLVTIVRWLIGLATG